MADKLKKRGRRKYKKLNISRMKRAFQKKQKTFFIVFEGLSFSEKYKFDKKLRTQALSSIFIYFYLCVFFY